MHHDLVVIFQGCKNGSTYTNRINRVGDKDDMIISIEAEKNL
jgi:hypothetical protein